jgi:hypothetical protein
MKVARGSGLDIEDASSLLDHSPLDLLDRIGVSGDKVRPES